MKGKGKIKQQEQVTISAYEMEVIQKLGKIARIDCSDDIRLEIIKNRE